MEQTAECETQLNLQRSIGKNNKDLFIHKIMDNDNVKFFWSQLTLDITNPDNENELLYVVG